jgi:hypothetical protein
MRITQIKRSHQSCCWMSTKQQFPKPTGTCCWQTNLPLPPALVFGKVTAHCKTAAAIVNYLRKIIKFFGSGQNFIPTRVIAMNKEIFKTIILDFLKSCMDTNLQQYYVGDGVGDVTTAGLQMEQSQEQKFYSGTGCMRWKVWWNQVFTERILSLLKQLLTVISQWDEMQQILCLQGELLVLTALKSQL